MDFLATKGLEYLLAIAYLLLLVPFWRWLMRGAGLEPAPALAVSPGPSSGHAWFNVPDGFHFHRGHGWARASGDHTLRVGLDDLAHRLLGPAERIELPEPGDEIRAGEPAWAAWVDGQRIPILSPVSGRVEAVHRQVLDDPARATDDPYGDGWLFEVRADSTSAALRNLLPTRLARAWTESLSEKLSAAMSPQLGTVLADGGRPVAGLARELAGEDWPELARSMLSPEDDEDAPLLASGPGSAGTTASLVG